MRGLIGRLKPNADGTWKLPEDITPDEIKVVECVTSGLSTKAAFDDDRLYDEFIATLRSNGLITKDEARDKRDSLRPIVLLYAISKMHNCRVQIGDGTATQLKASTDLQETYLTVGAIVRGVYRDRPDIGVDAIMFKANVDPKTFCHPDLLAEDDWDFEIELGCDGRLSPLR